MISGIATVIRNSSASSVDVLTPQNRIENVNLWVAESADVEIGCGFFFDTSYAVASIVLWRVSVCSRELTIRLCMSRRSQNQEVENLKFSCRVSAHTMVQLLSAKLDVASFSKDETIFSLQSGFKSYALVRCKKILCVFRYSRYDTVAGCLATSGYLYLAIHQASGGVCLMRKQATTADLEVPAARSRSGTGTGTAAVTAAATAETRTTMLTVFNWNGPVRACLHNGHAVLFSGCYAVPVNLGPENGSLNAMYGCYPAHVSISLNRFAKHVSGPVYTHISPVLLAEFHLPDKLVVSTAQHSYVWSHPSGQLLDFQIKPETPRPPPNSPRPQTQQEDQAEAPAEAKVVEAEAKVVEAEAKVVEAEAEAAEAKAEAAEAEAELEAEAKVEAKVVEAPVEARGLPPVPPVPARCTHEIHEDPSYSGGEFQQMELLAPSDQKNEDQDQGQGQGQGQGPGRSQDQEDQKGEESSESMEEFLRHLELHDSESSGFRYGHVDPSTSSHRSRLDVIQTSFDLSSDDLDSDEDGSDSSVSD